MAKIEHQLNEEIKFPEIRLIDENGAQLGIFSTERALAMADTFGLDLVCISPAANPPVCKIMDYSKFCYDKKKQEKEARKKQKVVEVKEIRMSPGIDTNDINTKLRAAERFVADGNRVKVTIRFRGREIAFANNGKKLLLNFAESCSNFADMEKEPVLENRSMSTLLAPKKAK